MVSICANHVICRCFKYKRSNVLFPLIDVLGSLNFLVWQLNIDTKWAEYQRFELEANGLNGRRRPVQYVVI